MNTNNQVECRRAIEALRAGVPNRDAVLALGCEQPAIEERFRDQLRKVREGGTRGAQVPGLLVAGDFGAGKSHLLEYLQHIAMEANFVCSKVVISKETPLHDPVKFYRSAIHAAAVPGRKGAALREVAMALGLNPPNKAYGDLCSWVHDPDCKLDSRFAATLFLVKHLSRAEEELDQIIRFWSGERIGAGELKRLLKACGERATYRIERAKQRDLAIQRFQFVPRLMVAAGYSGWVLLVDEVELIGRYSPLQRGKSYAELARWAGRLPNQHVACLTGVFAITSNFEGEVLEDKNDLDSVPHKLRDRGLEELAEYAERGMKFIQKERSRLKSPDREAIPRIGQKVREIYARAYDGWEAPEMPYSRQSTSTVLRQYIKSWINQWDLERLYGYRGHPVVKPEETETDYMEDSDLENPSAHDADDVS
jgi:hypothetical protein